MEGKARKIGVAETEIRRIKRRRKEEKSEKGEGNRNKESSRGMGNLG